VFGEPFADSSALPTHYLSRETRKFVKVALSGDGGDELFGGYDRYRAMRLGEQLRRIPGVSRLAAAKTMWRRIPGVHPKSTTARIKRMLESLDQPADHRYAAYMSLMDDPAMRRLMPDVQSDNETRMLYASFHQDRDAVQAALATDRISYLPDDLLAKVDRCSMLHALEVRSPFMDHDLVNFAAALSSKQLLAGGAKRLLREAFADELPAEILGRGKMGFAVPIGEWFRNSLKEMLRDHLFAVDSFAAGHFQRPEIERLIIEHDERRVDHSQRLYALLMLELWWRT
jgi:asparagine synthase (glutamine-hydrolysing)